MLFLIQFTFSVVLPRHKQVSAEKESRLSIKPYMAVWFTVSVPGFPLKGTHTFHVTSSFLSFGVGKFLLMF